MDSSNWNMENKCEYKYKWEPLAVVALRIIIGAVFILSGFVKAVDLWGVEYKIEDYLTAFGWNWAMPYTSMVAALLPLSEFLAGTWLLLGSFRNFTVIFLTVIMAFMLPLTGYIAVANPVEDCGCFGDAFTISNWATFFKNLFITAGLIFLLKRNKGVPSMFGPAVQWMTVLFPSIYALLIMVYGLNIQPVLDFRPYKVGTSLCPEDNESTEFIFTYEKDGKRQNFDIDNLPDSTWTFVDRIVADKQEPADCHKISFFDAGEDISGNLGIDDDDVLLMLIGNINDINVAYSFQINEFYKKVSESGFSLICLTGSNDIEIREWKELSMADYPVYTMDDSELKSIARGNPAIVWLHDGMVMYKSTFGSLEFDEITAGDFDPTDDDGFDFLIFITLILLASLIFVLLINRSPLLIKLTKQLSKNQNKELPLQKK